MKTWLERPISARLEHTSHIRHTSVRVRVGIDVALRYYLSVVFSDLLGRPHWCERKAVT